MPSVNCNTINNTLHITADIYYIIMKNRFINNCFNQQFEYNKPYYRNIYKKKIFEKVMNNQLFCSNFCGDITNCSCFVRYDNRG
jgi:hypothetical protein